MSNRILTLVWDRSSAKGGDLLVLLAIADRAKDDGSAFPSIADISRRARLSARNARRAITRLQRAGELNVHRGGGRKSNRYKILLGGVTTDGLSRQMGQSVTPALTPELAQRGHQRHRSSTPFARADAQEPIGNHLLTNNHPGGVDDQLVWPTMLSAVDRDVISKLLRLQKTPIETAQILLDELSSAIGDKRVRSPTSYARALIERASKGEFVPERAHLVREAREARELKGDRPSSVELKAPSSPGANVAPREISLQYIRDIVAQIPRTPQYQ